MCEVQVCLSGLPLENLAGQHRVLHTASEFWCFETTMYGLGRVQSIIWFLKLKGRIGDGRHKAEGSESQEMGPLQAQSRKARFCIREL